jgi:hypothetical protein
MGGRGQRDNKAHWRRAEPGLTRQRRSQVMTRWNVLDKSKKIHGRWNKKFAHNSILRFGDLLNSLKIVLIPDYVVLRAEQKIIKQ